MRYLKKYEIYNNYNFKIDNINVGDIYIIKTVMGDELGKITDITNKKYFNYKRFSHDLEEMEFFLVPINIIKRKATPEEIQKFEILEKSKKYNL